jgi:hypothetical protein
MLCHLWGLTSDNPFPAYKSVTLAHPDLPHALLITGWQDEQGYRSTLQNLSATNGRSLTGALRVTGGGYLPPHRWQFSMFGSALMQELFELLLRVQAASPTPIGLSDRVTRVPYLSAVMPTPAWLPGSPTPSLLGHSAGFTAWNCQVTVDEQYAIQVAPDRYLLQFQAEQI